MDNLRYMIKAAAFNTARYSKYLKANPEKFDKSLNRLYNHVGLSNPITGFHPHKLEGLIESANLAHSYKIPNMDSSNKLYKPIMDDIQKGNFTHVESGMSLSQGKDILLKGPRSPGSKNPFPGKEDPSSELFSSFKSQFGRDIGSKDIDPIFNKASASIWVNNAGTARTKDYAERAGKSTNSAPARLSFKIPSSLAKGVKQENNEMYIPRHLYKQFAKDIKLEDITGQLT